VRGSLVDDDSLVAVLHTSQNTSAEIKTKLSIAEDKEKTINSTREEYRSIATRGSLLFFVLVSLPNLNPMYEMSLAQFLTVFDAGLRQAPKNPSQPIRVQNIADTCTWNIFQFSSQAIFSSHRLLLLVLICLAIDKQVCPCMLALRPPIFE
jgi:dynein heavy chain